MKAFPSVGNSGFHHLKTRGFTRQHSSSWPFSLRRPFAPCSCSFLSAPYSAVRARAVARASFRVASLRLPGAVGKRGSSSARHGGRGRRRLALHRGRSGHAGAHGALRKYGVCKRGRRDNGLPLLPRRRLSQRNKLHLQTQPRRAEKPSAVQILDAGIVQQQRGVPVPTPGKLALSCGDTG